MMVTATLLVTCGRISDQFGRVCLDRHTATFKVKAEAILPRHGFAAWQ
jgi:hypothetical protein